MQRGWIVLATVASLWLALSPAQASQVGPGAGSGPAGLAAGSGAPAAAGLPPAEALRQAELRVREMVHALDAARRDLQREKELVRRGLATQSSLAASEARVRQAEARLSAETVRLQQAKQAQDLQKVVTVDFKDLPVRSALELAAQGTGLTVALDPGLANGPSITLRAREVPVEKVLQAIAEQAGGVLVPAELGLTLRPRPVLEAGAPGGREWGGVFAAFHRPVDIRLQEATIRQAAEALTRATHVPIAVHQFVPNTTRVTLDARGVPFQAVLEALAISADVSIVPVGNTIVLKEWPTLTINGEQSVFYGDGVAPWSAAWRELGAFFQTGPNPNIGTVTFPGGRAPAGGNGRGSRNSRPTGGSPGIAGPGSQGADEGVGGLGLGGMMGSGLPGLPGPASQSGLAITAVGTSTVIVAEPGTDAQGFAGYWLTLYRVEGTRLRRVSRGFHRSGAAGEGGRPGMGGGAAGSGAGGPAQPMRRGTAGAGMMPEMRRPGAGMRPRGAGMPGPGAGMPGPGAGMPGPGAGMRPRRR